MTDRKEDDGMERKISEDGIIFLRDGQEAASLQEQMNDQGIQVAMTGYFTGELSNDLWDEIGSLIIAGQGITLHLGKTEYLSPSVMDVILRLEQRMEEKGKFLLLTHVPEKIYADFKKRGLHELLEIKVEKKEV